MPHRNVDLLEKRRAVRNIVSISAPLPWWEKKERRSVREIGTVVGGRGDEVIMGRHRRDDVFKVCKFGLVLLLNLLIVSGACILRNARSTIEIELVTA